jgi:hypothetical protein
MSIDINVNKMKSKYIRTLIREAIKEAIQKATVDYTNPNIPDKVLNIDSSDASTIDNLKRDPNVRSASIGTKKIKEMARRAKGYELVDPEMDETVYGNITYSGTSLANVITFFKDNPGSEKSDVQRHFGFVRPQIANAVVNELITAGILAPAGSITTDQETGEITIAPEEEPEYRLGAEDFFVGNKMSKGLDSYFSSDISMEEPEMEEPEEPEIPNLPIERTNIGGLPEDDYQAWMEYSKYKERLARTKSALIQLKKQRRGGDDLSYSSNEIERLSNLKSSLEQRLKNIVDSSEYVKNKLSQSDESEEEIVERFQRLANIR